MWKIRTVENEKDVRGVSDLISKVYNYRDYYEHYEDIIYRFSHHPCYRFSDTIICELNKEIVGHLKIVPQILRVGSSQIKSGGFAGVCVKTPLRKKGIARSMIEFALKKLEDENYDISLLFGIPDFYHRFGFVPVFKEFQTILEVKTLKEINHPEYKIGNFQKKYSVDLWKIYHRYLDRFPFFPLRPFNLWEYRKEFLQNLKIVFYKSVPVGYFNLIFEDESIRVEELVCREDLKIYQTILNFLRKEAVKKYRKYIKFNLCGMHPFIKYLKGEDITYQIKYRKNSGAMGKVLNWESLFSKLLPEFFKNLKKSCFRDLENIDIYVDKKVYSLDFKNKSVKVLQKKNSGLKFSSQLLTQLVFGYDSASSLCFRYNMKFSEKILNILDSLFPCWETIMFPVDRF